MQRQQVKSSNVRSVGYDEMKQILEIEFISGAIYQYLNVPENIYIKLMTATSIGKAVHELLRGNYDFKTMDKARKFNDSLMQKNKK